MILRSILLNNFGLYAGVCEIDLVPRKRAGEARPIILIGGKNGAGKTTLLEGVRLALYGRRALGTRVGQSEYDDYLRKRVHHSSPASSAAVGLEFDYAEAGLVHRYRVRREWAVRGKSVVESLLLEKDGALVTAVPREEWHQFLQELIPPGVSQLFFFDGEKIREIAEADESNEQLAAAVRGLLGIDLVERARTDLGLYLARHDPAGQGKHADRLEEIVRDLDVVGALIAELGTTVAELTSARESQARASELIRRRFVSEGGDAAAQRGRLEAEREEVRRQIAQHEQELKELANGLLPFTLAPQVTAQFQKKLTALAKEESRVPVGATLSKAIDAWKKNPVPKRTATWSAKHWSDLHRFLNTWSSPSSGDEAPKGRHFPEVGDANSVLNWLNEMEATSRPRATALGAELERLTNRLAELGTALARADNANTGFLLEELRTAEQKVGSADTALQAKQDQLATEQSKLTMLERERKRLLEEQASGVADDRRAGLATRAARVLADFERRLLERKVSQLQVEFVRHFNYLARKDDLVADVRINPETFAATLVGKSGHVISKGSLSAGEQQIYAIAMLWALAKTSGRLLPMIIDTPLARLDSEHRNNLIERYFPFASHQVVLLSTDTELDTSLLSDLGNRVSHTYRLDYEEGDGRTAIVPGYFTDTRVTQERRNALQ